MSLTREEMLRFIDPKTGAHRRRFTQDSPILPEVWKEFGKVRPARRLELLLTPHTGSSVPALAKALAPGAPGLVYNESVVLAELTFAELIRVALPLTNWWRNHVRRPKEKDAAGIEALLAGKKGRFSEDQAQFVRLVGETAWSQLHPREQPPGAEALLEACRALAGHVETPVLDPPPLWMVSLNRRAERSIWRSRLAIKADAATRLFDISCRDVRWAVVDSGVDAAHPAFRQRDKTAAAGSRVVKSYDFTRLRDVLRRRSRSLQQGRPADWTRLAPLLASDAVPQHPHGTHVAGILAADWRKSEDATLTEDLVGMCPDMELYDLRVLGADGAGDEFTILSALQFVRYLNASKNEFVIHGVNLSLSLRHDVENYACGRTPICEECERLVASGVVVVVAAGNQGYSQEEGLQRYHDVSITDPGNTESVITVGATHRFMPHAYGVSYFSSRGPTGDGRAKPDLVAPGEKIKSAVPGANAATMDGTSMAAPHASGAAALIMARHRELIGQPARVKQVLCRAATDLGRERHFQGAGMLDVLRAIQSV